VAFSGSGHALGEFINIVPVGTKAAASSIIVDDSKPMTTIQVRLMDGSRLAIKCNLIHTIGDIRSHIEANRPSGKAMELRLSYPNKLLADENQTVQDAGLANATIVQRLF
jgi:UBX domain-containing protein 1